MKNGITSNHDGVGDSRSICYQDTLYLIPKFRRALEKFLTVLGYEKTWRDWIMGYDTIGSIVPIKGLQFQIDAFKGGWVEAQRKDKTETERAQLSMTLFRKGNVDERSR